MSFKLLSDRQLQQQNLALHVANPSELADADSLKVPGQTSLVIIALGFPIQLH